MPLLHFATYNLVDLFFFGDLLSKVFGGGSKFYFEIKLVFPFTKN